MCGKTTLALTVLVVAGSASFALAAQRCPGGRFLVRGALLGDGERDAAIDALVVEDGSVSIASGCAPVRARMKASRKGTKLRAEWTSCAGAASGVRLRGRIDRACWTVTGVIDVRDGDVRHRFSGTRVPTCGNGLREADEGCDDGNTADGDCCSAACAIEDRAECTPTRCRENTECRDGAYCERRAGQCEGEGVCRQRPEACIGVLEPACGCDGRTYVNACEAARAGVNVAGHGRCKRRCGTILGIPCPEHKFCEHAPGMCDAADLEGMCVPVPEVCPEVYQPVCGCDGKTYGNDCERRGAEVQKAHDGRCECRPLVCEPPSVPRDTDGDGCPDRCVAPPPVCASNDDCAADAYCAAEPGHCEGRGLCVKRPEACPRVLEPVCGCDGRTYGNACLAAAAGVRVGRRGACPCPFQIDCAPGTQPVDRDGDGCPEVCLAPCRTQCDCYRNPDLRFPEPCQLECATCDNYWVCEDGYCDDRCGPVPPGHDECPAPRPCAANGDCAEREYCAREPGSCDARGVCTPRPQGCPDNVDPVCGCDGKTYSNACDAAQAGVSVAARGRCPAVCGTIVGIPCPEGQFCEFPPGMCNAADLGGRCVEVADACPELYAPVCGCDGKTYGNDCERRAAKVQKAHDGPCECKAPECRDGTRPIDTDGDGCPDTCLDGRCRSNADCREGSFCAGRPGHCEEDGVCVKKPEVCPRSLTEPVCGCDGLTYPSACAAAVAGVRVASLGACACTSDCECYRRPFEHPCPLLCPSCGNYWRCEEGQCVEHCGPIPPQLAVCRPYW